MINNFLIEVVSWIYSGVAALYNIFLYLARLNIFSTEDNVLAPIIRRMYTVIGVVMLFFLAYSMLRTIVNPDAKDKNGTGKIILDVIKAIIVIAIVPTAFEFAFVVQDSLLEKNTIGKIILGTNDSNSKNEYLVSQTGDQQTVAEAIDQAGIDISITIFESFFYPYIAEESKDNETIQEEIANFNYGGRKFQEIHDMVVADGNFNHYKHYADVINEETRGDGYIVYNWVFAIIAGGFCLYMMISYNLSLALRLVKLALYEIIAPLPAMADIIPGKKDMLKKWIKVTLTTFFEAMLRIAVLFLMVYLIRVICVVLNNGKIIDQNAGFFTIRTLRALLIMGCLMFAKQAPQLISEITGIDSKNMSMGIKDKLSAGGAFMAGGLVGGALSGLVKRGAASKGYYDIRKKQLESEDKWSKLKGAGLIGRGVASAVGGLVSGGWRGATSSKDAKTFGDMKGSIHKANSRTDAKTSGKYTALTSNPYLFNQKNDAGEVIQTGRIAENLKYRKDHIMEWATGKAGNYQVVIDDANQLLSYQKNAVSGADSVIAKFKMLDKMGMKLDGSDILDAETNEKIGKIEDGKCILKDGLMNYGKFKGKTGKDVATVFIETGALEGGVSIAQFKAVLSTMTKTDFSDAATSINIDDYLGGVEYNKELDTKKLEVSKMYTEGSDEFETEMKKITEELNKKYTEAFEHAKERAIVNARNAYGKYKEYYDDMVEQVTKATQNTIIDHASDFKYLSENFDIAESNYGDFEGIRTSMDNLKSKLKSMGGTITGQVKKINELGQEYIDEVTANVNSDIKSIKDAAEALRANNEVLAREAKEREEFQKKIKGKDK
ncbi:MAG: hypothetical protein IJA94_03570 [Bacilli bacterium]|nr:hypothetical protein [Bacilli bacterium]